MKPFLNNVTKISAMLFAVVFVTSNLSAQTGASKNNVNKIFAQSKEQKLTLAEQKIIQLTQFIEEGIKFKAPELNDNEMPVLAKYELVNPSKKALKSSDNKPARVKKSKETENNSAIKDVEAFRFWLKDNLKDQLAELNKKGNGEVVVGFAIDEKGNLSNIKIINSSDEEVNKVVMKLLCNSPQWMVRQIQSQPYKLYYSVSVKYNVK